MNIKRIGTTLAMAAMALLGVTAALTVGGSTAHAADVSYGPLSPAHAPWFDMEVRYASTLAGVPLVQSSPNGKDSQQWVFPRFDGVTDTIVNKNSGMCVYTDGVAGHQLFQEPCVSAYHAQEQWTAHVYYSALYWDYVIWFSNPASGLVIDVTGSSQTNGDAVIGWYPDGGLNQTWLYV